MYKTIRTLRIGLALICMGVPTVALIMGYSAIFSRMQSLVSLIAGSTACLVFWLAVSLVYGRLYCSTVCPLGTAMDGVSLLGRLVERRSRAYRYRQPSAKVRITFFTIAIVLILCGGTVLPTLLDPFTAYARTVEALIARPLHLLGIGADIEAVCFSLTSTALGAAYALFVVVFAWRHGRRLCNTACPAGSLLGFASRRAIFHFDINTDKCINCGECERVCKSGCIDLCNHTIDTTRCVVCFDCTAICPNDAITYRSGRHRLSMPMLQTTAGSRNAEADCSADIQKKITEKE